MVRRLRSLRRGLDARCVHFRPSNAKLIIAHAGRVVVRNGLQYNIKNHSCHSSLALLRKYEHVRAASRR